MSSTKGKNDPTRKENDFYPTPQWCVDILAKKVGALIETPYRGAEFQIIDLGAGDGRIGRTVRQAMPDAMLTLLDINEPPERREGEGWIIGDFLRMPMDDIMRRGPTRKLFVGNPPFSQATEFIKKVWRWVRTQRSASPHSFTATMSMLLRLNWLGSEVRADWMNTNTPNRLTILAPRPSFVVKTRVMEDGTVKKSSNDSSEYAWTWWETNPVKSPPIEVGVWPLSKAERRVWKEKWRAGLV